MSIAAQTPSRHRLIPLLLAGVFAGVSLAASTDSALALSELQQLPGQAPQQSQAAPPAAKDDSKATAPGLPLPDPLVGKSPAATPHGAAADGPAPEIFHDISKAPEPVRKMRQMIVEAAASGDIERLRSLLGTGAAQTQITGGEGEDPITTLKGFSGDGDGLEVLAILLDILSTGYARVDAGTPEEAYVWPYFANKSLATLTPPDKVELLRIVTAGDLADMQEYGNYSFFRVGITPDGKWKFFSGGD
jgi:hypothetical protein